MKKSTFSRTMQDLRTRGARAKVNGEWQTTENVAVVNTVGDEGWPYVTQNGKGFGLRGFIWVRRRFTGQLRLMARGLSRS